MNIIKFKDILVTDTSNPDKDWYNENLRGKYAYWIHCRYVVPLDAISQNTYVSFETTINNLFGETYYRLYNVGNIYEYIVVSLDDITENQKANATVVTEVPQSPSPDSPMFIKTKSMFIKYIDLWEGNGNWAIPYIDQSITDKVNDINELKSFNNYIPDVDITLDELKRFRTWLAEQLLNIKNDWSEDEKHILSYYASGMYDDNLKWIQIFGKKSIELYSVSGNKCGCTESSNLSSLYNDSLSICDPVEIYKEGIKNGMVDLFSKIETWSQLPSAFLSEVKRYIDGILQAQLPFAPDYTGMVWGCDCLKDTSSQSWAIDILQRLSTGFQYLSNDDINGHKNFIAGVLNEWSINLYELMYWD